MPTRGQAIIRTNDGHFTDINVSQGLNELILPLNHTGPFQYENHVMACYLTAPNHYLNQCWLIIYQDVLLRAIYKGF